MDYSSLDKDSSEQLFLQIRRIILKAIRDGELRQQQRMPSVNELSANLGVSRMTVRQALQTLIQEGWLYTVPGKGTFIADRPHVEQNLQTLKGWTEEIRSQGMVPSHRIISVESIPAGREIAKKLKTTPGERVTRIVRVRYANDFPLTIEKTHVVQSRFPEIGDLIRHSGSSLYDIFRKVYGANPTRATQFLEAGEADQSAAELLDLKPGTPVLISERTTYAVNNDPLEYVYGIARPGFVRFKTELNVDGSTAWEVLVSEEGSGEGERLDR